MLLTKLAQIPFPALDWQDCTESLEWRDIKKKETKDEEWAELMEILPLILNGQSQWHDSI